MIGLYVDESSDESTHLVCGILAKVEAWDRFVVEWDEILDVSPSLPYWHQSSVWARNEPFDRLSSDEVREREFLLALAIRNAKPRIIATVLKVDDYRLETEQWTTAIDLSRPGARARWERDNHPYSVLHNAWIEQIHREADGFGSDERVRVVLEASDDSRRDTATVAALRGWNDYYLKRGYPNRIDSIEIVRGKCPQARPLEAADIAAWVVRRRLGRHSHHHLSNLILNQEREVRYIELAGELIRGHFDLTARIALIERLLGD